MIIKVLVKNQKRKPADLLIVGAFQKNPLSKELQSLGPSFYLLAKTAIEKGKFSGKSGEIFSSFHPEYQEASEIVLFGLGEKAAFKPKHLRKAVGNITKMAKSKKASVVRILITGFISGENKQKDVIDAFGVTPILANYQFDKYKSKKEETAAEEPKTRVLELLIEQGKPESFEKTLSEQSKIAAAVNFARDLINEPGNVMNPKTLAQAAKEMAQKKKIKFQDLEKPDLEKLGMNGILAVNRGSVTPPHLVVLDYGGSYASKGTICLVGKGVTFDCGGISIKPSKDMEKMKYDMSGAAAVIAVLGAASDLKLPLHIVGLVPMVENMVAEDPQRPGDIIKMYNEKTVEVINTDAEGRLILADALSYAEKFKPKAIIDVATLTGMAKATFDNKAIAMMGNDERLLERIRKAGEATGERCWPLPLWEEYLDLIKGHHSDLLNSGSGFAGTITAAMFLKEFVPAKTPWVHLDIAGTSWCDSPRFDCPKGASGAAVRLLVKFLMS